MSDIDNGPDDTLSPSESTDSDEVGNADGDEVVDPPEEWHGADRADTEETLERKLAAEEPEQPKRTAEQRENPDDGDQGDDSFYSVVR
ncbi:hypothetical protein [Mycolicibacterium neworleansense]|uniref:PAS domain S-box/diguanylate cyclase (GGDEF) domain-containing protein n=1 Tax=Mycolicibacterium neworleansense TaxID=146018 RepID=A0A0H5S706_9MYCO|nr:hypothetical protein [Mycolicibacterium neworleansense]MCV7361648.1 hypothetical protein [Mycolicibacterium neworleansense]CRZ17004.1 hypothetical protein BN2156_03883 [Mycolicibacterium neworleansense]